MAPPQSTCDEAAHLAPQGGDENLQPPLVQQVLPLPGVEAELPAAPGPVGGILPVRGHAGPEDGVGLAGLQETAGLDLGITPVLHLYTNLRTFTQTWL